MSPIMGLLPGRPPESLRPRLRRDRPDPAGRTSQIHRNPRTTELGDWHRFRPQSLGPFLGLTPSEHSSGEQRRQGGITKTGNTHARRLLVEAAWQQRRPLRESPTLAKRRQGQPAAVRARADRSARRLHQRWHALERRGKRRTVVAVAVARELAGHCWALATM